MQHFLCNITEITMFIVIVFVKIVDLKIEFIITYNEQCNENVNDNGDSPWW